MLFFNLSINIFITTLNICGIQCLLAKKTLSKTFDAEIIDDGHFFFFNFDIIVT